MTDPLQLQPMPFQQPATGQPDFTANTGLATKYNPLYLEDLLKDQIDPGTGEILAPFDFTAALVMWEDLERKAAFFKEWEMTFRKRCSDRAFPEPKKGVNTFPLGGGYILKMTHKVNVKIDETMIPLVRKELEEKHQTSVDGFLKKSYSLVGEAYTAIANDEVKNLTIGAVLRQMITTTPASPSLEITLPAKAAKAAASKGIL